MITLLIHLKIEKKNQYVYDKNTGRYKIQFSHFYNKLKTMGK